MVAPGIRREVDPGFGASLWIKSSGERCARRCCKCRRVSRSLCGMRRIVVDLRGSEKHEPRLRRVRPCVRTDCAYRWGGETLSKQYSFGYDFLFRIVAFGRLRRTRRDRRYGETRLGLLQSGQSSAEGQEMVGRRPQYERHQG